MNVIAYLKNPVRVFHHFNYTKISHLLSDKALIKLLFRARLGYKMDFDNPITFNQKIQWLKVNDRKAIYTQMVDKYLAKEFVAEKAGMEYVVPLLGVWDKVDDIDISELPEQFVLKCSHDNGSVIICKNINGFDFLQAKCKLDKALNTDFFFRGREWAYKDVKPRVIAEELLSSNPDELTDYKFFVFNGVPKIIEVCSDRFSSEGLSEDFFDLDWNHLTLRDKNSKNATKSIEKPSKLNDMALIAQKIAHNIPFLRVDFYCINDSIKIGEMTFYPDNGYLAFNDMQWDVQLGSWLTLPDKHDEKA